MKVVVTGASGMLGHDLVPALQKRFGVGNVLSPSSRALDITSREKVFACLKTARPQIVVNAAAYTNVDGAETEVEAARALNAQGPALLAEAARELKFRLLHFSTDQVFDGEGTVPRTEEDLPRPLNAYAATKWEGEKAVLALPDALVLRVQWLYGKKRDRFRPILSKQTFTPFSDQRGAPTWTKLLAEDIAELLERRAAGLYHYAHDDWASWYEIYQFAKAELGASVQLIPKLTHEVTLPAKRPLFSVLSNQKISHFLGRSLGSWKPPLRAFLKGVR